ncbi:sigma-70 family RNA polymerase sigma factor [Granulosicoccus antarcticus]|nr:sigma-70 family RNA polymerase sigma factor [Granulosicoccus antarcticus]
MSDVALLSSMTTERWGQQLSVAGAGIHLTTDMDEDGQLMKAYAGGDAAAFETLYSRHKQPLFRFVKNSCGNEAIAHELYQDIWLHVIKGRSSYRLESPFRAWLYRIARNRLIDHYRQQPVLADSSFDPDTHVISLSTMTSAPLTPDEIAELGERAQVLHAALQTLPATQRESLLLRYIAGMSLKEVAAIVNEGTETIKSRLRYATAKLRTQLKELSQ